MGAGYSQDATARDSKAMLAALGLLAYALSMMAHEALGHGGVCLASGGHNVLLTPWAQRCSLSHVYGLTAAGPGAQFGVGLLAWLVLHQVPFRFAILRCFLWLSMVFGLLISSGYVAFSGITGFGDAAVVISGLQGQGFWRGVLVIAGASAYYLSLRVAAMELSRFDDSEPGGGRLRRLVWIPYLAAGALACGAAALNRTFSVEISLQLAVASSFGAGIGMLRLPKLAHVAAMNRLDSLVYVRWDPWWALAAAAVTAAFLLVLGPGWVQAPH